jgi:hypothetical protein
MLDDKMSGRKSADEKFPDEKMPDEKLSGYDIKPNLEMCLSCLPHRAALALLMVSAEF